MATTNRDNYEYVDENSISEDLLCPLCTDPLAEPLCANQCGHTFCRQCITTAFRTMSQCPTCRESLELKDFQPVNIRPFLNQLNQLLVKCKMCSTTNIQRGNFNDHAMKCSNVDVSCPAEDLKCNWKGKRNELDEHTKVCPLIKVQPMINELNERVKEQSEQIRFLGNILKTISKNHKKKCEEQVYANAIAYCDICKKKFLFDEHKNRLHFCPNTDVCSDCVRRNFS